ncbi:uncharacterized protein [Eleutherodactylus coqui]|uniref:uncharacterized protein n=1 Tax=Eleutherodactylus coqui TaxID=57060 RepID=UPI003462F71B
MELNQLREKILSFSLDDGPRGNQGYSRVLLQLFGYMGHGKSSFINSCKYVLEDSETLTPYAEAGETEDDGAMTTIRAAYDLTENITMVDNRGYKFMDSFERAEIYAQLGNFIPIGEKVEWTGNYTAMMHRLEDAELNPNYSDFIVPILIYSATCCLSNRKEVQTFMDNCVKMTGVVPIIIITKKKSGDFIKIEKQFKLMGAEVITAIENYTNEDQNKTLGRTKDILMVIHRALADVTFHLGQKRNSQRDWRERKKFLLEYIHKSDLEKKEEERKKEDIKRGKDREKQKERRREEKNITEEMLRTFDVWKRPEVRKREEEERREEERWREEARKREEEERRVEERRREENDPSCIVA